MAVELAVLIPVIVVAAALAFNLLSYLNCCARFDRVAAEAVRVHGVSPGYGGYGRASCATAVEEAIRREFDGGEVAVSVEASEIGSLTGTDYGDAPGLGFALVPTYRRYTCTLEFRPGLFGGGVFGAAFPPVRHSCTYIVDPFVPTGWL